jgi:ATP-dependent helicase/nuclease subunit A
MAKRELPSLPPLKDEQLLASEPSLQVRLSASAGTGKTQVLSARVLRLLLNGVAPESILCLTFTKAGAAEMADRIHDRLGAWVTMSDGDLAIDLKNLGENIHPDERDKARSLFAKVLDARGSGLRIQTIHSFCQTLLGGFPAEAGLAPGFRAIEGREEQQLADATLAQMVENFIAEGRDGDLERLKATAKHLSEGATLAFLSRCAADPDAMEGIGPAVDARVRAWLGIHEKDIEAHILAQVSDDVLDTDALSQIRFLNAEWGTATAKKRVTAIHEWQMMPPEERAQNLEIIHDVWATGKGEMRSMEKKYAPQAEDYAPLAEQMFALFSGLISLRQMAKLAEVISTALHAGREYARAYVAAKRAAGVVDFNDIIRNTVTLLKKDGIGAWIKYKLDQSVDHILVDEAQDTNDQQWDIVKSLAEEFFAGDGVKPDALRTIFMVGDFKQAIFGFQGTDPRAFEAATDYFKRLANGAEQEFQELSLNQSFRSSPPILAVTDKVIDAVGHVQMGLDAAPDLHVSAKGGAGSVTLLPYVTSATEDEDQEEDERGWLSDADLKWANALAKQVKHWTMGGLTLKATGKPVEPKDIMILVRKRGDLARLIVSRLYQEQVEVAGVDRLQLNTPIVVQDLLVCIRFALQPKDDLSLASILVSPLMGWSQDDLYALAQPRDKKSLWEHLRTTHAKDQLTLLTTILNMADMTTPYRFLEAILSGPSQGRKKLIARLGDEARDPIEELLNAALGFEQETSGSLQLFLDWFDKGEVQIKRDPSKAGNAVRVMTVHGSKGLQAPVVVLADATSDPDFKKATTLDWAVEEGLTLPLFRPKSEARSGSLKTSAEAQDAKEREEHWRLLYVAMTRAEEHLFIGGALRPKQIKNGVSDQTWYYQVDTALQAMGVAADEDGQRVYKVEASTADIKAEKSDSADKIELYEGALPAWAIEPARAEARPPKPLAPSAIVPVDDVPNPPPDATMRQAARRGVLLHSLLERLPLVASERRVQVADTWLQNAGGVVDDDQRREMVGATLRVLNDPGYAQIFSAKALAEAPLAGVVDGRVIAGTVDRLLITDDRITVVDFKTGRRVPDSATQVSKHHLAQMAAYVAVLEGVFPGRQVDAALLYTSGPRLIPIDPATLAAHKPGFMEQQLVLDQMP